MRLLYLIIGSLLVLDAPEMIISGGHRMISVQITTWLLVTAFEEHSRPMNGPI